MLAAFGDPLDTFLNLQRELEPRWSSDWLVNVTTARGPFPPINVFQQGDDILAIIELPGMNKSNGPGLPSPNNSDDPSSRISQVIAEYFENLRTSKWF